MMKRLFTTSILCSIIFDFLIPQVSTAQTIQTIPSHDPRLDTNNIISHIAMTPFTPSNDGVPGRTAGGGSRDQDWCPTHSPHHGVSLVPLVAMAEQNTTTEERPSFLFYIANQSLDKLLLSVKDEEGTYDYQAFIPIPNESGVLKISLPDDAPPLRVNKTYEWGIAIACTASLRPDDPFVLGQVQRIASPDMIQKSPTDQLAWYASHNVWYDTINLLAVMRAEEPDNPNLTTSWNHILRDVGLEEFTTAPLLF